MELTKQQQRICDYIDRYGSISPMEAFSKLGVTKLATQISLMRRECGMAFQQEYVKTKNRFGEKCHYMRYSFPVEQK